MDLSDVQEFSLPTRCSFTVPGVPVPKARARVTMRGGFARAYTPKKTADYESVVASFARTAARSLITGPVSLEIEFRLPIPMSWSKKRKAAVLRGEEFPVSKPDLDNLVKSVKDGMNGIVWKDDSQVVVMKVIKVYSENIGCDVYVRQIGG